MAHNGQFARINIVWHRKSSEVLELLLSICEILKNMLDGFKKL